MSTPKLPPITNGTLIEQDNKRVESMNEQHYVKQEINTKPKRHHRKHEPKPTVVDDSKSSAGASGVVLHSERSDQIALQLEKNTKHDHQKTLSLIGHLAELRAKKCLLQQLLAAEFERRKLLEECRDFLDWFHKLPGHSSIEENDKTSLADRFQEDSKALAILLLKQARDLCARPVHAQQDYNDEDEKEEIECLQWKIDREKKRIAILRNL